MDCHNIHSMPALQSLSLGLKPVQQLVDLHHSDEQLFIARLHRL
jgi:hypothetical protein